MESRFRKISSAVITLLFSILIGGCHARSDQNGTHKDESVVIRWGVFKSYQPVFIAKEKGFFEQEGVHLEFTGIYTSGPALIQAASINHIDAGHSAISGIINAASAGIPVIGVADSQTEFNDAPLMQWFVLKDSPIKMIHDLKGRKIGVNSLSGSFYNVVLTILAKNGLTKDDVEFVIIPHHNQEQALYSGQIDVAGLIDPYTAHIMQGSRARTLFRAVDVLGENQFSLIFFNKQFIVKHFETVRRFIRAYNRAIDFISTNPDEASSIMSEQIGVPANLIGVHRFTPNAEVRMKDVQFWIDEMRRTGELKDHGKVRAEDVATTQFTSK